MSNGPLNFYQLCLSSYLILLHHMVDVGYKYYLQKISAIIVPEA